MLVLRTFLLLAVVAVGLWALGGFGAAPDRSESTAFAQAAGWDESDLWLAPAREPGARSPIGEAADLLASNDAAGALSLLEDIAADDDLAPYAELHRARAYLGTDRPVEAAAAARRVLLKSPAGHVGESALRALAQALEHTGAWHEVVPVWQSIEALVIGNPAPVVLRLAQAAEKAGDRELARSTYARVFDEWPATGEARDAETALARFPALPADERAQQELERAGRLYDARRFGDAYTAYARVQARTTGADRLLVDRRLAQCDVQLQRYSRGLSALEAYLARPNAEARDEAGYFVVTALRGLKRADYPARVAPFVAEHPDSVHAEAAMNDLATHYILADQDDRAEAVFAEMYERWPTGRFADRAAWRAGWWAYRADDYRRTIRYFEPAALAMRRADYRPLWLYWTAQSYAALGERDAASLWYLRTIADYRNSYYGRLAWQAFETLTGAPPSPAAVAAERDPMRGVAASTPPSNAATIRRLLEVGLWDDAIAELRRVQAMSGTPMIDATLAYALNRKGDLRPAINTMRRAYPQFMSDGGQALPERILKVIFPVAHAETIRRHAAVRGLDPYLLTALVAQESTFQPEVVSSANAVGLMQLLPSTGRRYATRVGLVGFTTRTLTDPESNVRLGTAYLSDLLTRYDGDVASALAAYNAGENRVDRWRAERPGVPRDEFVDDIPFPETQNYVKRILGTAEDYRLLYAASGLVAGRSAP